MNATIRPMHSNDVEAVYALEREIFRDAWSLKQIFSETDGEIYRKPFVLEVDGILAGYVFVWCIADEIHINNFAIHPSFRRKGLGLKLISFIFDEFKDYKKYFLEVRRSNRAAINLYKKNGFEIVFTRINYYADGEDALVMHKILE